MHRRRTTALLTTVATALSAALVGSIGPASAAEEVSCNVQVVGVQPNGKLLARNLHNARQTRRKVSRQVLPFVPTNLAAAGWESLDDGTRTYYVAIARSGRPGVLAVADRKSRARLATRMYGTATTGFAPRLFAMGFHPHALALEGSVLRQYRVRSTDNGIKFVHARVAMRRMKRLKTLTFYNRQRVNGVRADIYYATTKAGALLQIRIPVRNPGNASRVTLRSSGFRGFTGLSMGSCGEDLSTAMIVGINRRADVARWYTLDQQGTPKRRNLTDRGRAGRNLSWNLRATV